MAFKKNSPGCICCTIGVSGVDTSSPSRFVRYSESGSNQSESLSGVFGSAVNFYGIDIERKYLLVKKQTNNEIWLYDPLNQTNEGKLWELTCDVANPAAVNGASLWYIHSWGLAYGIVNDDELVTLDSSGDFLNGPYTDIRINAFFTMLDNGDLYTVVTDGPTNDWGVYVNGDIENTSSDPNGNPPTYQIVPPVDSFAVSAVFSDGVTIYISGYQDLPGVDGDINIIYEDDGGGVLTEIMQVSDILIENERPRHLVWNPLQDRWEGAISLNSEDIGLFYWFQLEEGKFIKHFRMGSNIWPTLAIGPSGLEDIWDEL